MAFEDFTTQLLARAAEARDPGSADAYLRLTVAAEATLKLASICLLSEGVYRYGSEPAKGVVSETIAGHGTGLVAGLDVSGRLPGECELARRLMSEPSAGDRVHELWTAMDELLKRELDVLSTIGVTKRKSLVWRHALRFLPFLRNKVKGHGAPPTRLYAALNPMLREMVENVVRDLVAPLPPALAFVRPMKDGQGLFLRLGEATKEVERPIGVATLQPGDIILTPEGAAPCPLVPLVTFEERTRALLVFNDSVAEATGELEYIDYLQGQFARRPSHFVTRHGFAELAASETSASATLSSAPGVIPNNLPERRRGHVPRAELEAELTKKLLDDKHRLVSLDGRGGIGKTYLATQVCQRIASDPGASDRFGFILWMSGRDVDLTVAGPKPVKQDLVTLEDVLRFVLRAFDGSAAIDKLPMDELTRQFVATCKSLHPLLVLDNFETFAEPKALHSFVDDVVPFPAKVLITSRHKYFKGDFPLPVGAMSEAESRSLILDEARMRHVLPRFESPDRVRRVYEAAQGHAYTMRLIVAQVSDRVSVHDACTLVEKSEDVLSALFERSLRLAEPVDAEIAAILAALRTECPLEALLLLPIPRQEIEDAVGRLFNLSLLEKIEEPVLHYPQYLCPRAAGEYIRRKRLLESPEARERLERTVQTLRSLTLSMRSIAKKTRGGIRTRTQAADVMMTIARNAMKAEDHALARRAVAVAVDLADEDPAIAREAAVMIRKAGSGAADVDGMFERALGLDPTNAASWNEWGHFKMQSQMPGQAMACFERALEADPRSREAVVNFAGAVLEVLKQEKKLGAGAVRQNDRRPGKSLAVKARNVLDAHLAMPGSPAERARLMGLRAWTLLQIEGLSAATKEAAKAAEELDPASGQIKSLVQTIKRMEAERKGG